MDVRESISRQTDVSWLLAQNLISSESKGSNLVFSPLSLHVVLGLIAAGSKGPTRDQLLGFLKSNSSVELQSLSSQLVTLLFADGRPLGGPLLSFANGVWLDQTLTLKPAFKQIVENAYKAACSNVDFQTKAVEVTQTVNAWAEKETNGLIKDLLPHGSVDASTRLILGNAVYFKGAWSEKFDPSLTKDHEFFLLNGSSIQAPFMTSNKKQYARAFDDFKVLRLPYHQGEDKRKFSMYIFLPKSKDGLPTLIEKISSESGFIKRHLPYDRVSLGDFCIPKFKISSSFEASELLKKLGLALPFSHNADLTELIDSPVGQGLSVSSIFHKAFIEVNEEGTEAAAASAAVIQVMALFMEEKLDFVADHPFLFAVTEDSTGVLLFVGAVQTAMLGFQHYIVMLGTTVMIATILVARMGGGPGDPTRVIQTLLFMSALNTLCQTWFGTRLPTVMGPSFAYVIAVLGIINDLSDTNYVNGHERFTYTMRAIQGSLISSFVNILLGYSNA